MNKRTAVYAALAVLIAASFVVGNEWTRQLQGLPNFFPLSLTMICWGIIVLAADTGIYVIGTWLAVQLASKVANWTYDDCSPQALFGYLLLLESIRIIRGFRPALHSDSFWFIEIAIMLVTLWINYRWYSRWYVKSHHLASIYADQRAQEG